MEGDYTILDRSVQSVLRNIDDIMQDKEYAIVGGMNVQLLIAEKLCSRTGKDIRELSYLRDSFLLRKTGDIDIIVDSELPELTDLLFNSRLPLDFKGIDEHEKRIDYKKNSKRIDPLQITFYSTKDEGVLKQVHEVELKAYKKDFSVNTLSVEDIIIQKLDNGRNKDIGDVQRIMMVYGSDINDKNIYNRIKERFEIIRASALESNYNKIKQRLTENK